MKGTDLASMTYEGIDMAWLEGEPRRISRAPRSEARVMRAQSLVVPWYESQRRVKSLVGTDVRVKRVA